MFRALEYPSEVERLALHDAQVREHRANFLHTIVVRKNTTGVETFINHLEKELHKYELAVQEAAQGGVLVPLSEGTSPIQLAKWNHVQAIFFASTIITTIGYGNIVPETLAGRIFCIVYAVLGIPLCVTVIADLGAIAANSCSNLPSWMKNASSTIKSLLTALGALVLLLFYISIGATLFMFLEEEWSFFDSFYFCFITMTTIGFGDLVPQKPQYMFLCTLYILVGLGLTSTIIEIVRTEYAKSWERLQALAEALRKLGDASVQGTDLIAIQNDIKKAMTSLAGKRKGGKNWEKTIDALVQNINKPKPQTKTIIVYETSV